jgi:hypothetical protein
MGQGAGGAGGGWGVAPLLRAMPPLGWPLLLLGVQPRAVDAFWGQFAGLLGMPEGRRPSWRVMGPGTSCPTASRSFRRTTRGEP